MLKYIKDFFTKYRGYFVVFGGFIVELSLGSFFTNGNIQKNIVDYMRNSSKSGYDVTDGNIVWITGLTVFGVGISVSTGGFLDAKIGPIITVLIGGWFYSLNVCLTFFTIKSYLVVISLSNGLFGGIGAGLAYGVALGTPCQWFPKRKGLVLGIVVAGFGISPTIFDFIQNKFIDTNNTVSERLPESFYVLGLIYAALIGIGSLFLKTAPNKSKADHTDKPSVEYNDVFVNSDEDDINTFEVIDLMPHQLLFELDFWIMWLTFSLNHTCVVLSVSLFKRFGNALSLGDYIMTIAPVIGSLLNCIGRIFWGVMSDKKSYKALMLTLTLSTTVLFPSFYICSVITNETLCKALYMSWIILLNFFLSGNFSILPNMCAKLFGMKHLVANYGLLLTSVSFASAITTIIITSLWPKKELLYPYLYAFIAGGALSLVSALLTILFRGKSLIARRHQLL